MEFSLGGGVYQLGNYTNAPDMEIISQQTQNREDVLNTLVKGSYMPNDIKKCSELITSDKKKGNKNGNFIIFIAQNSLYNKITKKSMG